MSVSPSTSPLSPIHASASRLSSSRQQLARGWSREGRLTGRPVTPAPATGAIRRRRPVWTSAKLAGPVVNMIMSGTHALLRRLASACCYWWAEASLVRPHQRICQVVTRIGRRMLGGKNSRKKTLGNSVSRETVSYEIQRAGYGRRVPMTCPPDPKVKKSDSHDRTRCLLAWVQPRPNVGLCTPLLEHKTNGTHITALTLALRAAPVMATDGYNYCLLATHSLALEPSAYNPLLPARARIFNPQTASTRSDRYTIITGTLPVIDVILVWLWSCLLTTTNAPPPP
ncbi:hypothetical protein CCM_07281 [Cordyceps militaris CM01]|uniref:Uncharacterized protein n=1 Tax=Cordyceps militaris (strain CM01) TaxID=983644 RepID=G3JMI2_CORMM|nr:uncharacterized protein CCM_07281 [Cordyceps militaris CM01]EGX90861.1 hypothetical protein CCM_07281 [Cordyceps militaris CM01]